jgi:hypothetical protein
MEGGRDKQGHTGQPEHALQQEAEVVEEGREGGWVNESGSKSEGSVLRRGQKEVHNHELSGSRSAGMAMQQVKQMHSTKLAKQEH